MRFKLRWGWHKLIVWLFKSHFQDMITETVHPEFGVIWREGEIGHQIILQSYENGRKDQRLECSKRLDCV